MGRRFVPVRSLSAREALSLPTRRTDNVRRMQLAIGLYDGFTALDAVGPYQVLTRVPDLEVVIVASQHGPVPDDLAMLSMEATATFGELPNPDILLVIPTP